MTGILCMSSIGRGSERQSDAISYLAPSKKHKEQRGRVDKQPLSWAQPESVESFEQRRVKKVASD